MTEMPPAEVAPRLLYVLGSMRSGTTMISRLIGSAPGTLAIGELNNTWRIIELDQRCSCGATTTDCRVWGPSLVSIAAVELAGEMRELRARVERQRRIVELLRLRQVPRRRWPADVARYVDVLRALIDSLSEHSGATTLVDSSKSAAGFCLAWLAVSGSVSAVHLLRDPRGVVFSEARRTHESDLFTKAPPRRRSVFRSLSEWNLANAEATFLGRAAASYVSVWYEDICRDPATNLDIIWRQSGVPAGARFESSSSALLTTAHILAGNPSRIGQGIDLQLDEEWRRRLSVGEQRAISVATLPTRALVSVANRVVGAKKDA